MLKWEKCWSFIQTIWCCVEGQHVLSYRMALEYILYVKALKDLLFLSNQVTRYFSCSVFLPISSINLTWKVNLFNPLISGKYCLIHLEIVLLRIWKVNGFDVKNIFAFLFCIDMFLFRLYQKQYLDEKKYRKSIKKSILKRKIYR